MIRPLFLIIALSLSAASAEVVCSVHDGDTFRLCNGQRIRVWGIDAPELKQPFGRQSRDFLSGLVLHRNVALACKGRSYKRRVCRVRVGGLDVNRSMVGHGWAYDSPKYSHGFYAPNERAAHVQAFGVWRQPGQLKPWAWRKLRS